MVDSKTMNSFEEDVPKSGVVDVRELYEKENIDAHVNSYLLGRTVFGPLLKLGLIGGVFWYFHSIGLDGMSFLVSVVGVTWMLKGYWATYKSMKSVLDRKK